jgi:glutamate N-acetyltransferase/amino-acid N-acetyltransferase
LTTDALIEARLLLRSLEQSIARSLGRLSIDNDVSPNDGVILLANGAAGGPAITDINSWEYGAWQEALDVLCNDLTQQIVRDTAANSKLVQIHVRGGASEEQARQVAVAVARSSAVRWSCARSIPDWGSIMVAVGGSGAEIRAEALEIRIGSIITLIDSTAARYDSAAVVQALSGTEVDLLIDLHMGSSTAMVWTCTPMGEKP